MKAGVGYAEGKNAFQCGHSAGKRALESGSIKAASFVHSFCTNDLDVKEFKKGLRSAVGDNVPIAGATTVGVLSNNGLSYQGCAAVALVLQSEYKIRSAMVDGIEKDPTESGIKLAQQLELQPDDKLMFLLYDMIKKPAAKNQQLELNSMLALLNGVRSIADFSIPIFGGGLIGDYDFNHSVLFNSLQANSKSALGIVFSGAIDVYSISMHGCAPLDGIYHTITKMEKNTILELDGRPADVLIDDIYQDAEWRRELPVKDLTIARNLGAKYESFRESNYINRVIPGTSDKENGISIPEQNWTTGTEIQFMIRDNEEMMQSARRNSRELVNRIAAAGKKPVFGIYFDCAGRTAAFSNSLFEEASYVQKVFNEFNIPLLGCYSGIELGTVAGNCVAQEWTGLLVIVTYSLG